MSEGSGRDVSRSSEPGGGSAFRSRQGLAPAPSSRGSNPLGLEGDEVFGELGGFGDIPDLDVLVQGSTTQRDEAPSVSPEIEALLQAAAVRARGLIVDRVVAEASDVLVSTEVTRELAQLFEGGAPRPVAAVTPHPGAEATPRDDATAPAPMSFGALSILTGPESLEASRVEALDQSAASPSKVSSLDSPARRSSWLSDRGGDEPRGHLRLTEIPSSATPPNTHPLEQRPTIFDALGPSPSAASSGEDAMAAIASAVRARATGALVLRAVHGDGERHVVFRDGDIVTVDSSIEGETLLHVLAERGEVSFALATERSARLPRSGRHAAAALIAQGFLPQDALWSVLRAHAEWLLVRAFRDGAALGCLVDEVPERLASEPSVFGGATGVEVFVEATRRALDPASALARLGNVDAVFVDGVAASLVHEAALDPSDLDLVRQSTGRTARHILKQAPESPPLLAAMAALDVLRLEVWEPSMSPLPTPPAVSSDDLDEEAVRSRIAARLALVQRGDYFALLGLRGDATGHEVRQAYIALRRDFEPSRLLTASTRDLEDEVRLIRDVIEEAYSVLSDERRRARYRKAIESAAR